MNNQKKSTMKKHILSVAVLALIVALSTFSSCRKPKAEDNTPAKEGLYLGIVGFNNELYTMPLGLLNQDTKHNFESFVDGLSMQSGTILYHAVNTSLNSLASAKIPKNLINVSVVTFTDGLDEGSHRLSDIYSSGTEYLSAVNTRIMNESIGGNNISAYSIGVRGLDVTDTVTFKNNLRQLSSDPNNNVSEVSNMSEASVNFAKIAQQLYNQSTIYNVMLKIIAQNPNTIIRFTFDNVNDPNESNCYIQGKYIEVNNRGQLTEIQYHGLESITGVNLTASSQNIYDTFTFQNLTDLQGNQMSTDYVKFWTKASDASSWNPHSEFTPSGSSETVNQYKSAMIMLVLDCSSSLGSDFVNMKTAANGFIETLSGNYNGR